MKIKDMITEDYVSFEVAKLLKEKGFNVPVWTRYEDDEDKDVIFGDKYDWNSSPMGQTSTPTHQIAMKWLRDKHSFFIVIDEHFYSKDLVSHISSGFTYSYEIKHINTIHIEGGFETYEEACEKAIKYCLENLI